MERVLGIGGYFVRLPPPAALGAGVAIAWARTRMRTAYGVWKPGLMVFATLEPETDYFESGTQQTMLNFRGLD